MTKKETFHRRARQKRAAIVEQELQSQIGNYCMRLNYFIGTIIKSGRMRKAHKPEMVNAHYKMARARFDKTYYFD